MFKNFYKKNYLLIVAVLLAIMIMIVFIITRPKKLAPETILPDQKNIEENLVTSNLEVEQQEIVFEYLKKNISTLSPEKEVLGGTFYITSIDFLDKNNLIVDYEDGHVAFTAKVTYDYIDSENIIIDAFEIVNK